MHLIDSGLFQRCKDNNISVILLADTHRWNGFTVKSHWANSIIPKKVTWNQS